MGGGGGGVRGVGAEGDMQTSRWAIQVVVAVTGTVIWAVLACFALDALEELVDS